MMFDERGIKAPGIGYIAAAMTESLEPLPSAGQSDKEIQDVDC